MENQNLSYLVLEMSFGKNRSKQWGFPGYLDFLDWCRQNLFQVLKYDYLGYLMTSNFRALEAWTTYNFGPLGPSPAATRCQNLPLSYYD